MTFALPKECSRRDVWHPEPGSSWLEGSAFIYLEHCPVMSLNAAGLAYWRMRGHTETNKMPQPTASTFFQVRAWPSWISSPLPCTECSCMYEPSKTRRGAAQITHRFARDNELLLFEATNSIVYNISSVKWPLLFLHQAYILCSFADSIPNPFSCTG